MLKKILAIIIIIAIAFGIYKLTSSSSNQVSDQEADMILFWGQGCPHCETVKNYVKDNKIDSKLKINQKEVYYNKANQSLLNETAKKCNFDSSQGIGVPFAYMDDKCFIGDQPIIDAINQKLSQN